jgi:hypothetical protein
LLTPIRYHEDSQKKAFSSSWGRLWTSKLAEKNSGLSWCRWSSARYARALNNSTSRAVKPTGKTCRIGFRLNRKFFKTARLPLCIGICDGPAQRIESSRKRNERNNPARRASRPRGLPRFFTPSHLVLYFFEAALPDLRPLVFFPFSSRSITAATISGNPTVASTNTSPNFPPSDGGTNFPHEIASL